MPNLMRVSRRTTNTPFAPRSGEDVEAAEQASDYVNYIIQNQCDGYKLLHTFFKDALLFRMGVIKYFWEEVDEVDEEEYNGLTEAELVLLLNDPNIEIVEQRETVMQSMMDEDGVEVPLDVQYDLSVRVTRKSGQIKAINVPPEEFSSRGSAVARRRHFVAHCTSLTVSSLWRWAMTATSSSNTAARTSSTLTAKVNNRFQTWRRRQALIRLTRPCAR